MSPHELLAQRIEAQRQSVIDAAEQLKRHVEHVGWIARQTGQFASPCSFIGMDAIELVSRIAQLAELQTAAAQLANDGAKVSGGGAGPAPCQHSGNECGCPSLASL